MRCKDRTRSLAQGIRSGRPQVIFLELIVENGMEEARFIGALAQELGIWQIDGQIVLHKFAQKSCF